MDPADVAVLAMEPSGLVVAWNPAMARLAATPADRAIGRHVTELFKLTDQGGETVDLAGIRSGIAKMTMSGGRSLWVEVSCSASAGARSGALLTPLTMIHGHAQLLDDAVTEENARKSLEAIHDAVEMMRRVIADLAVAVNDGPPSPRAVPATELLDVPSLMRRTLQSLPSVADRSLLSSPSRLLVRGDPVGLRQCLLVVLANVLKPYYRSAATEDLPGTGLGLHIAEVAISAMRGRIDLASAPSGGLRVALRLPLGPPEDDWP
ncbi:sensor histidine kinase [Actinomadura violacea]|uniref:Sensor-like histidine kinase SenX3 n=1 Tax=Actinomadura violacea TaxID=2819934 RepID=A0ABS3S528_9ACTN|nr:PAS domain-containing sensor histidine kinase [Actinomadura violacea]MBO2464116.1 PAS domain-containing sensor histidine kinase [Actinomadura violacea]